MWMIFKGDVMRLRKYTTNGAGKLRQLNVLVSWSQRTCILCHKFLSKHQQKYCSKCYINHKYKEDRLKQIEYRKRPNHVPWHLRLENKEKWNKYRRELYKRKHE